MAEIFFILSAAYALVSAVALIQLIRTELRVPEYGWTTQKVFYLMNFIVNGVRAVVFGFHKYTFSLKPMVLTSVVLDMPGLLSFTTYTILVIFWAKIYYQATSLPTDKLRTLYLSVNGGVYFIQLNEHMYEVLWPLYLDLLVGQLSSVVVCIGEVFTAVVSFVVALSFLLYGGRLFFMILRYPKERSKNKAP